MKIVRDGKGYELTAEELAEELAEQAYDRYIVNETARQKENVSTGRIIPDSNLQKKNNHAA